MPDVSTALPIGMNVVGGLMKGDAAGDAAGIQSGYALQGANLMSGASAQGVAEIQKQLAAYRDMMSPYLTAGTDALSEKRALLGLGNSGYTSPQYQKVYDGQRASFLALGGDINDPNAEANLRTATLAGLSSVGDTSGSPEAQQAAAVAKFENSPYFQAITKQSEDAILQNASATGGLRGGNTQDALSKNRPILLQGLIDKQIANLTGLTSAGQSGATALGSAGLSAGGSIASTLMSGAAGQAGALTQAGQAEAGGVLGQSNADVGMLGNIAGILGNKFAGGTPAATSWTGGGLKL